jgi:hypothetical protein
MHTQNEPDYMPGREGLTTSARGFLCSACGRDLPLPWGKRLRRVSGRISWRQRPWLGISVASATSLRGSRTGAAGPHGG